MEQLVSMLGSIGFNWHIALANFVNFVIVFAILHFLVFKKLAHTLEVRKNTIKKGLDDASTSKELLANAEKERATLIKDAEDTHLAIIKDAEDKAILLANEINGDAKNKASFVQARLEEEHALLRTRTEKEFSDNAPRLVAKLYEKLLKENMTEVDNNRFISAITASTK